MHRILRMVGGGRRRENAVGIPDAANLSPGLVIEVGTAHANRWLYVTAPNLSPDPLTPVRRGDNKECC